MEDLTFGEQVKIILGRKGMTIKELAETIQNAGVPFVWIQGIERNEKVLSNLMVDLQAVVDIDPAEVGVTEQVYYPVLAGIIEESAGDVDEMKRLIKRDLHDLIPKHITKEDITKYLEFLKRENYEITSIARKLTAIKNFHKYLNACGIVSSDVSITVDRPRIKKKLPDTLTVDEVNKLLDIPLNTPYDYRNKAMLELLYGTGLRISELLNLKVSLTFYLSYFSI